MGNEAGLKWRGGSLVLFPGALGDAVCVEPVVAWLGARGPVTFYARGAAAEVAEMFPDRPRLGTLDGPMISGLFAPAGSSDREIGAWLSDFQRIVSFTGSASVEFRSRLRVFPQAVIIPFPRQAGHIHAVDEMLIAVSQGRAPRGAVPRLAPPASARGPESSATPGAPRLILHPGSGGSGKRAPRELFSGVARLWRQGLGGEVSLLLGPAEAPERGWWTQEVGSVESPATVRELAGQISQGSAYFGNDAGPSHVAAALGVPSVVWFQSTAPDRFGPRGEAVRHILADSPKATAAGVYGSLAKLLP